MCALGFVHSTVRVCVTLTVEPLATRAALECFSSHTVVGFASLAKSARCEACEEIGSEKPSRGTSCRP
jgi:hypothetical protein